MHERAARVRKTALTWGVSLLVHLALVGIVAAIAVANLRKQKEDDAAKLAKMTEDPIAIDLPLATDGETISRALVDRVGEVPVVAGGATIERIDTNRDGRSGEQTSPRATHLSDRNENLHLTPDSISHLERDQIQRIKSDVMRASWEDRRMTTHPMELTFLTSGKGTTAERRDRAKQDPSRGALRSKDASREGGAVGTERDVLGDSYAARRDVGDEHAGTVDSSPGTGLHDGREGTDHHATADVMYARPELTQGPVNVPATFIDRPRDNVNSDQDVATALRSIVHGSYAGGVDGNGNGGTNGGGAQGAEGTRGEGSHPAPLGMSDGDIYDLETSDPRLLTYFRRMKSKIDPLWQNAFPRSAILDLKQGTVILEFTVFKDGSAKVTWPPKRASGIDEFDRNCAEAIKRALPFEPIPAALNVNEIHVRAPFIANNYMVK